MGLDLYAYKTKTPIPAIQFKEPEDAIEIHYWRKHYNLYEWMQQLYQAKGGKDEDFNLSTLRLDPADIDTLEKAVLENSLPDTTGSLFGETNSDYAEYNLRFIATAREAFAQGYRVYFLGWW